LAILADLQEHKKLQERLKQQQAALKNIEDHMDDADAVMKLISMMHIRAIICFFYSAQ
jgi:hypothetical protein